MISNEQMDRAEREFAANASASVAVARDAERALEHCEYYERPYDIKKREQLFKDYQDADYMAESRAWILHLIRKDLASRATPPDSTSRKS